MGRVGDWEVSRWEGNDEYTTLVLNLLYVEPREMESNEENSQVHEFAKPAYETKL